ncbi:MAG: TIGR02117 family protein [Flammeovirgaceae bacterium]
MNLIISKSVKFILYPFILLISLIGMYILYAWLSVIFPVNTNYQAPKEGIEVFIVSNGFHTEWVLPIEETQTGIDWLKEIGIEDFQEKYENFRWIGVGWGDEGFLMESYQNQLPSTVTTLKAVLLPTPSLVHITFYRFTFQENENCRKILINKSQYEMLAGYILASFAKNDIGKPLIYRLDGYGQNDHFFRGIEDYHLFNTCNDWTNNGMKIIGLPAARKAPFAESVMYFLPKSTSKSE